MGVEYIQVFLYKSTFPTIENNSGKAKERNYVQFDEHKKNQCMYDTEKHCVKRFMFENKAFAQYATGKERRKERKKEK